MRNSETVMHRSRNPSRRLRRALAWATGGYWLILSALLALLEWHSEPHWTVEPLLYLPVFGWLLPLALLVPLCLAARPALCLWHLLGCLAVLWAYLHWRWAPWPESAGPTLTVLTANVGGRKPTTLRPFVDQDQPDVIACQEAGRRRSAWLGEYPDYFVRSEGEFVLASRFPVRRSGYLTGLEYDGRPVVAWFEVEFEGGPVVIYSVHMPTPRPQFRRLRGRGFAAELAGRGGIYSADIRRQNADYWRQRIQLTRDLIAALRNEEHPFLVVGDFNTPDHGCLYRPFTEFLTDAFATRGRGWGFTFPGDTRNPVALFSPWLRLDYLFADQRWRPLYCRVEPRRNAQHRAVAARFEFRAPE